MTHPAALSGPISAPGSALPGQAIVTTSGTITDLSTMTDEEFNRSVARAEKARVRVERILESVLIPGAHFGNPPTKDGGTAFTRPVLFQAGAETLATTFRLAVFAVAPDRETTIEPPALGPKGEIVDPGFVSVTVHRGLYTSDGAQIGTASANCNSRERRFRRFGSGSRWTYDDARETLHDCISMAEKRAKVRLVRAALGLTAWLASEEEMEAATKVKDDKPIEPWSEEEKKRVYGAAQAKGLRRRALERLVSDTLGTSKVGTGPDVERLLAAIAQQPLPAAAAAPNPAEGPESSPAPGNDGELPLGDHRSRPPNAQARD